MPTNSDVTTNDEEYLASYNPRAYAPVAVTVDVAALTIRDDELHVLLVQRTRPPQVGLWALPGGFVTPEDNGAGGAGERGLGETAVAVLERKTGLVANYGGGAGSLGKFHLEQLGTYGDVERDPRMRVISVAYMALAPELADPDPVTVGGIAKFVAVSELGLPGEQGAWVQQDKECEYRLAFDHARILVDAIERARSKLEYTPLATAFAGEEFTIPELRCVYEVVWDVRLTPSNFHRKVLSVPGFLEQVGGKREGSAGRGPRAALYRRGDATLLHPALLRPGAGGRT
jgi:8-oxo-dGTP diphosphatase